MSRIDHADPASLARGFTEQRASLRCLHCEATFDLGEIHPVEGRLLLPERAAAVHVADAHGGPLEALLALGKSVHGLSEVQSTVVGVRARGGTDADIADALGGRSPSTVRNHRFQLRRKHREARVLVALFDLLETQMNPTETYVRFHDQLPTSDDRTVITTTEADKLLAKYFEENRLIRIPKKEKHKLVILRRIVELLEPDRRYHEREINELLRPVHADTAALRRYLVNYRFVARTKDGSAYWRVDQA